ncbi:aminoglycoside N(3)-acetyltransferase [Deinococcus yavapaiensis]|uniref:Aminoglycoside N(3)-acetyltransferase n=1 Tax=Deinococcus yavapaiensis KR-236 TaxID=694435 RepID=A0A318S3X5_9DEIO|nr:AAC(3) family N-acetyltransferase [Deinococcus yavapaiensis]PYE53109.1 aminoglycoside 3-N-acetyltransferase [Deinococcus yavapaiensis KR-236]
MSTFSGERRSIAIADVPRTRRNLAADLADLGVRAGMTVLVHSSLSALGWVAGGPVAVIQALQDVVTPSGTIVMPAYSGDLSDPAHWRNPPVPEAWWPIIREETSAYDPHLTPVRGVGRIPELFRSFPGVSRSSHPTGSLAAWGRHARFVTEHHSLEDSMGEGSPFARVYDLDGHVLLLGTDRNSSLHLAEHRAGIRERQRQGAPIIENGVRMWKEYWDLAYDDEDFPPVKAAFDRTGRVTFGQVGSAACRLMRQREVVDFAVEWFKEKSGGVEGS